MIWEGKETPNLVFGPGIELEGLLTRTAVMTSTPRECHPGTVGGLKSILVLYDSGYTLVLASIEVIIY